jgi:hypothetical protein
MSNYSPIRDVTYGATYRIKFTVWGRPRIFGHHNIFAGNVEWKCLEGKGWLGPVMNVGPFIIDRKDTLAQPQDRQWDVETAGG